ncbi:MAG: hypothetical protein KKC39_05990 [Candidatus Omnitrophica bacterium]|nr:hypothetical protein [Candidatus Omnitrophota bacterium]MBU4303525.1 hypothetical protein [Candidatus Omnitrophota bacterium]MBU4418769.1 hypothetical protein [Candidatus Omnitrophota bacterium]MBU4468267.1 hypothetical protein [Candidatus Omnitrophota bacterium]MCG2708572.1 hypothetical protein [Candidatus Omnitrophota bacterium]
MSIINEALKKTEEYLQKNSAKDNPLPSKPPGPKPYLLYILILLAGLALGNFIFNLLSYKIQATQTPKKNAFAVIPATNLPAPAALPSQPAKETKPIETSFVLNGIFFSDEDGYALVNNQIVRENDYVDGAKVGSITANTVKLDNAGQTITLSTPR